MGRGQSRSPGPVRGARFSLSVVELINNPGKAQPCPGGGFVTHPGLQRRGETALGRINITGRTRGDVLRAPLWHRCPWAVGEGGQGHPQAAVPAQLQVVAFGIHGRVCREQREDPRARWSFPGEPGLLPARLPPPQGLALGFLPRLRLFLPRFSYFCASRVSPGRGGFGVWCLVISAGVDSP